MQISHRHKLIHCSQYGDYCRIDSFGDIPGQVDSLLRSSDSLDDKVRPRSGIWIEFADCEKVSLWITNGPRSQWAEQVKVQPSILDAFFSGDRESCFFKMRKRTAGLRKNLLKEEELFINY